ncbi:MAG TPA: glycosyltransferase family A protein [Gemmatimonadales bacterium]|nr:glycosyltransferase family A protein [Gemmatimonadales bacterium]
MTAQPLVSVVIPFLNGERFLEESIRSVLGQTYQAWELLLIDDGSLDCSSDIARRYADAYPDRVRYLEHPGHANRGATTSRNVAISQAGGSYIALLDADDVWLPEKLSQQITILETHPRATMVYGVARYWRSWTGAPLDVDTQVDVPAGVEPDAVAEPPALLTRYFPLGPGATPSPSDLTFRTDLIARIGGFEEEFQGMLQLFEDQAFLAKVYLAEPVFVATASWTKYRLHRDSCVAQVQRAGQRDAVRRYYLRWLRRYLEAQGVTDRTIWRALRRSHRRLQYPTVYRLAGHLRHAARERLRWAQRR